MSKNCYEFWRFWRGNFGSLCMMDGRPHDWPNLLKLPNPFNSISFLSTSVSLVHVVCTRPLLPLAMFVLISFLPTCCLFTPCPLCSTLLFPSPVGDACLRIGHSTRVGFEPTGHASCQLRVIGRISRLKLFP